MKQIVIIWVVLSSAFAFGQDDAWRDSLIFARKAYANKDYSEALKYYESAQRSAPENIDLSDEMAQSAYRAREFDRAEKIYQQSSGSKRNKQQRADAMHNMGNAQMRQKNYSGAVESYKEALRNNPTDEETRYNLSKAVRKLKEQKKNPPPPKDQNKPQDKNGDQSKNDQNDSGQNGKNDQKNNSQGQKESQNDSKNGQNKESQGQKSSSKSGNSQKDSDGGSSKGKLSNQMVERSLDELAKKERETKRRMRGGAGAGKSTKSGKDW